MQIGEIAPPSARNSNFLAKGRRMINQRHLPPTLPSARRAKQPCRAGANNDYVEVLGHSHTVNVDAIWGWPRNALGVGKQ